MNSIPDRQRVKDEVMRVLPEVQDLSSWLYNNPEVPMHEYKAVERITKYLEKEGFEVETGIAGLETAFIARYRIGGGGPRIGFLAEYDALPEVGHGCGHNIIAASCVGAAATLARVLEVPAEIIVFGTPDEEYDGGKIIMAEAGVFSGLDIAMQIHPNPSGNYISTYSTPHRTMVISFKGKAAHTAANPTEGVNALNAVLVTFAGLNALQQYLKPGSRMPATITHGGGAPNAVPEFAQMRVHLTTLEPDYLLELVEKVENCAKAGGLATGAEVDIRKGPIYKRLYSNRGLSRIMEQKMQDLGLKFDGYKDSNAATDVGNVSWECPTVLGFLSLEVPEHPLHSKDFALATISEKGQKALMNAIVIMAETALEVICNADALKECKDEFNVLKSQIK
ncbi:MAG: N-acyl-L-amino acid amidohydrolase [Firmicutes bacterium]|nr:N-acyl-L-amino acid amidohydrolase [Bacillota bacterium]MDI6706797.1 M20 family metallopeptidase [Bacillota bacterium]